MQKKNKEERLEEEERRGSEQEAEAEGTERRGEQERGGQSLWLLFFVLFLVFYKNEEKSIYTVPFFIVYEFVYEGFGAECNSGP